MEAKRLRTLCQALPMIKVKLSGSSMWPKRLSDSCQALTTLYGSSHLTGLLTGCNASLRGRLPYRFFEAHTEDTMRSKHPNYTYIHDYSWKFVSHSQTNCSKHSGSGACTSCKCIMICIISNPWGSKVVGEADAVATKLPDTNMLLRAGIGGKSTHTSRT